MNKLSISQRGLEETLAHLHNSGSQRHEGIVLWLGKRSRPVAKVSHVYQPLHKAAADFFHIPKQGMAELMEFLGEHSIGVLAQVHTHPAEAFHSDADDKWAMVRHLGALSLVLPYFAANVNAANFLAEAATFELDAGNSWRLVPPANLHHHLEVVG